MSTERQTIQTYNTAAGSYDAHVADPGSSPLHAYYEKPALHAELDIAAQNVLNIGCGSGLDNEWAHTQNVDSIFGIDISTELIAIAKQRFPEDNFAVMDAAHLGFRDQSFDVAYSSLVLHYLPDWSLPLREAHRVLSPGGSFVFSCNHPLETSFESTSDQQSRTVRLGRTIMNATNERFVYGDYLATESDGVKKIDGTFADEYRVQYYHRTFGKMIAEINTSGFRIKKLIEPVPLEEMKQQNPEHYKQVLQQPKFLIWVLEK